jgi:hypothetical protein
MMNQGLNNAWTTYVVDLTIFRLVMSRERLITTGPLPLRWRELFNFNPCVDPSF